MAVVSAAPYATLTPFDLTASATSSFHHHVSLCLHGPCAVSIIFFICCERSFTSSYFHSPSAALSLIIVWYSSHVFSSLSFHTCTVGSDFLCRLFIVLNHMSITNNFCFGIHSSFGMTLTLGTFALSCHTTVL